ncbi:hypothetical protein HYQ46_006559 [Verticillium longisporum]|nr:hypothetical protein HYQ46_006559 [Verticillium longisporum]
MNESSAPEASSEPAVDLRRSSSLSTSGLGGFFKALINLFMNAFCVSVATSLRCSGSSKMFRLGGGFVRTAYVKRFCAQSIEFFASVRDRWSTSASKAAAAS